MPHIIPVHRLMYGQAKSNLSVEMGKCGQSYALEGFITMSLTV